MPLKPHPTDPDKMVYVSRQYDIPQLQGITTTLVGLTPPEQYLRMMHDSTKRTWVGLTLDEIAAFERGSLNRQALCCAIEAKLKEKNT